MADEFDFNSYKNQKETEYNKSILTTLKKNKTTAGLVIWKFQRSMKKGFVPLFIPFIKDIKAKEACASIISDKLHEKKWLGCVGVSYDKTKIADHKNGTITLSLLTSKGGLAAASIAKDTTKFFKENFGMKLVVTGLEDKKEQTSNAPESSTDVNTEENTTTVGAKTTEWEESFNKLKKNIVTLSKLQLQGKLSKVKLEVNVKNCEDALSKLDARLERDKIVDGRGKVDSLKQALQDLRAGKEVSLEDEQRTEKSNSALDTLTSGIGKKAAQLLSKYEDQIKDIDGLADKLKSISEIA